MLKAITYGRHFRLNSHFPHAPKSTVPLGPLSCLSAGRELLGVGLSGTQFLKDRALFPFPTIKHRQAKERSKYSAKKKVTGIRLDAGDWVREVGRERDV